MALPMTWGPYDTLIPLYTTDLLDGKSQAKVGCTAFDPESLIYREALSKAYLALIYRIDLGGTPAEATVGRIVATAKYAGTTGNSLSVSVRSRPDRTGYYDVVTYLNGVEKDRQAVERPEELEDNDWITFLALPGDGDGPAMDETTGVTLAGGRNGAASEPTYAKAVVGGLAASARQMGAGGNQLSISVEGHTEDGVDYFDVVTYLNDEEMERQTILEAGELRDNEWITFQILPVQADEETGEALSVLVETPGINLTGGSDGTIFASAYTDYFDKLSTARWNVMALPTEDDAVKSRAADFIRTLRDSGGHRRQAVLLDCREADSEGIINVCQGYVNAAGEVITPAMFTATAASMTAAAAINQSNTFQVISGADEIVGPIADADVEAALKKGMFLITYRQDGSVAVEQDINSLHSFTPTKGQIFSKNRVVRVLDDIGNQILQRFESAYVGKVDNNDTGRSVLKADIISYLRELLNMGAIRNFDAASDISVTAGEAVDAVSCELWVQPADSMEKLYMLVNVGG